MSESLDRVHVVGDNEVTGDVLASRMIQLGHAIMGTFSSPHEKDNFP